MNYVKALLAFAVLTFGQLVFAANHFVRAGATGSGNGSDWTNAFQLLPATLVRGDTYYVADGSYPAYTFDDPESGALVITIKKATTSDHGTDAGWQAAYGDGQATFNSTLNFSRSYYVLDGQTRNESNWFDGASYGFRVYHNNQDTNIVIHGTWPKASNYITIKNTFVDAIVGNLPNTTIRRFAVDTDTYGGDIGVGQVFSKMYVRGANNVWMLRSTKGAVLEYSASEAAAGNAANHGEIVNLYYSSNNAIVRYNQFRNEYLNGGATALVAITYSDGLQYYGNLASNFQVGDAAVGFNGYYSSHNRVYNNTFIKGSGNAGVRWGSGTDNLTYNNLFINCSSIATEGTHDYNGFSDSDRRGEANAQTGIPTSIFVNYSGLDFRLATPTAAGLALTDPQYQKDMLGNTRGADGRWDRGAYEYGGPGSAATPMPTVTPQPSATPISTPIPSPTAMPSATPVSSPQPSPTATPITQTIFTTQKPALLSNSDGTNVNYELGLRFSSKVPGKIRAIRFYKSASEKGTHVGKIWSSTGTLLASVTFTNETTSGWQQAQLATPLAITSGTEYIVSVNTGSTYYVATVNALGNGLVSGDLTVPASGGVYGSPNQRPTKTFNATNYFRDIVFVKQ